MTEPSIRGKSLQVLKLIIVHFHLRPGGIRRIIELATPHIVRASGLAIDSVVLVVGEAGDARWRRLFQAQLDSVPVRYVIEPTIGYVAEQRQRPAPAAGRIRATWERLLADADAENTLVWAHNLGVGRNLLLAAELTRLCAERGIPLVAHHHDWWFDSRWPRWAEMRRCGFRTLTSVARTIFPPFKNLRHVAVNQADARILVRHFGRTAGWLPNLAENVAPPPLARVRSARSWLCDQLGSDAPVWILPCRFLRRKNVAEALLLARWLRPEAWFVTTGGASSADEQQALRTLDRAAGRYGWRLRLGILAGDESRKPSVLELLAASEGVMLTSIQEGFGLPYVEAAAAGRPLIARRLPNVSPDLAQFGFRFPQLYEDILVDPRLFDWSAEQERQRRLLASWKRRLPRACRRWTGEPVLLARRGTSRPVPFSRLTLTAQLEVLGKPAGESWERCVPLNPFLATWRKRAETGRLQVTPWPQSASRWLSGSAYARRFGVISRAKPQCTIPSAAGLAAQQEFVRARLGATHLFPLLWSPCR